MLDVAVHICKRVSTFGQWVGYILSSKNKHMFWIIEGFTQGFIFLSDKAEFLCQAADCHIPQHEIIIL